MGRLSVSITEERKRELQSWVSECLKIKRIFEGLPENELLYVEENLREQEILEGFTSTVPVFKTGEKTNT